jgi:hypothetical protein
MHTAGAAPIPNVRRRHSLHQSRGGSLLDVSNIRSVNVSARSTARHHPDKQVRGGRKATAPTAARNPTSMGAARPRNCSTASVRDRRDSIRASRPDLCCRRTATSSLPPSCVTLLVTAGRATLSRRARSLRQYGTNHPLQPQSRMAACSKPLLLGLCRTPRSSPSPPSRPELVDGT